MLRILVLLPIAILVFTMGTITFQRKLLYYPTHHKETYGLSEWRHDGQLIGYAREVATPRNVWLMMHGNGGQASDRAYALPSFSSRDSVYILEYPGYGQRPGSPSMESLNMAAKQAYQILQSTFPGNPVCVVGESIGSGPASVLATTAPPPDKIVLITPFDTLYRVAAHHFPYLPVRLFLRDNWDNIKALKDYRGPLEIYGARSDAIIPIAHSKALAESKPSARFHEIDGGHNDWAMKDRVTIRNP